jgi:DNA repair protein RecO (recombination protein O)
MRWQDEAVLLAFHLLGENKRVVTVLSRYHGTYKGIWRSTKQTRTLQPGTLVQAHWNARLEENMGTWTFDPIFEPLAFVKNDPLLLLALQSALVLIHESLPERELHSAVFESLKRLLCGLTLKDYCLFERTLLNQTSFPLDLTACAATGDTLNLRYVSPKSGRAVSERGAGIYRDRLLPLPLFFLDDVPGYTPSGQEILAALRLTGYFLERYSLKNRSHMMPLVRQQLYERLTTLEEKAPL